MSSIKFTFSMEENFLTINLMHSGLIKKNAVEFKEKTIDKNTIEIVTLVSQRVTNKSTYKRSVPQTV